MKVTSLLAVVVPRTGEIIRRKLRGGCRRCEGCDFTSTNYLIYIKLGNIVRKSGKDREIYQRKQRKLELSHSQC